MKTKYNKKDTIKENKNKELFIRKKYIKKNYKNNNMTPKKYKKLNNVENSKDGFILKKILKNKHPLNRLDNSHLKSKSLIESYGTTQSGIKNERKVNIVESIRKNKYLIPMIENKNIEKKLCYSKIKEAPYNLVDVISKVRNRSEPIKNKINGKNDSVKKLPSHKNNISYDDIINNNYNYNINNSFNNINNFYKWNSKTYNDVHNQNKEISYLYLTDNNNLRYNNYYTESKNEIQNRQYPLYNRHYKYISSLYNNIINDNLQYNIYGQRAIFQEIYDNVIDNNNDNGYEDSFNVKGKKRLNIDAENYLHNKKLFLIYRAKLFNLLYKSLLKYINIYFIALKNYAFNKIKQYEIKSPIQKDKILKRLFPNYFNVQSRFGSNNDYYAGKKLKNKRRINHKVNISINNSINTCKSCIQIIRKKNQSESQKRGDSSEMCRNIYDLKEKYEEIQKRKNFRDYHMNNMYIKNKSMIADSSPNCIYKKKKLDNYNDKNYSTVNIVNKSIKYYNNTYYKKKASNSFFESKEKKEFNNCKEKMKKIILKKKVKNNDLNKNLNKSNNKSNKNEQKDLNKLNKFLIRKIIKNIKSTDKRLFVNINYVYLSNIELKGKKEKYNNSILKIINIDNFSIKKNMKNNTKINRDKLIRIIEEEESSNFNCTHDSNNSLEYKNSKSLRNIYSNNNSNSNRTSIMNDKYLHSCANFVYKTIKRVILKNSYNFFKKRINFKK